MSLILPIAALTCLWSCTKVEELSKEAEITAFTFDKAVEANSVVTTTPVINSDGTITFSVSSDATGEQLSALVPTVTVSENATVTPASGTAVDFSNGPVTFTVTAQDGVTTSTYEAEAIIEEPDEPEEPEVTFPIDEITGTYKGLMDITLMDSPVGTDLPRNITISECSDTSINLSIKDFSFQGMTIGDIEVENCVLSETEDGYAFTGEQNLTLILGEMNVSVSGTVTDGDIVIDIQIPDFTVTVHFEGARLNGDESGEAEITSFTFEVTNPANEAVYNTVLDSQNGTVSVIVYKDTTGTQDLTALVPSISISAGATISPASGEAIDLSGNKTVTYTVVAENGTVKEWTVTVTNTAYFYDFEEWSSEGAMHDDILNPAGWATCNDAVALIKNMGFIGGITYDGEYPVRPTENGYEGQGAVIESVYTTGGNILGQKIPAVTAGTIFLGSFNAMKALTDPMATTSFGVLFEDKPVNVSGYLKYTAGTEFYDENGNLIDQQDLGTVNVVLYEVSSEDETLNGSTIYTSEKICATGTYETAGASDFTRFSVDLNYIQNYDPSKMYKLAVIFAASKEGAQYRAAKGSIMTVDNVTILCE